VRNYALKDQVAIRGTDGKVWVGEVVAFLPHPTQTQHFALVEPSGTAAHLPAQYGNGLCEFNVKVPIRMAAWMEGDLVKWEDK
jgi:hypothetical protein